MTKHAMKFRSTNAIENLNSGIVTYSRNVKRWQDGRVVIRWFRAAIVEAEQKFRGVQGWRDNPLDSLFPVRFMNDSAKRNVLASRANSFRKCRSGRRGRAVCHVIDSGVRERFEAQIFLMTSSMTW